MPLTCPPLRVKDEGTDQGSVQTLDFAGSYVSVSRNGSTGTVTVKGHSALCWGAGATGTGHNPSSNTTYYFSASFGFNPTTNDATAGITFPACTITQGFATASV